MNICNAREDESLNFTKNRRILIVDDEPYNLAGI